MKKVVFLLIFVVMIVSCGGNEPRSYTNDNVAPSWENGLIEINNISYSSVDLKWSGDFDNVGVTKYKLFKDDVLFNENINVKNFLVVNLSQDTSYKFKVEACDNANNCSLTGPFIIVKTLKEIQEGAPIWGENAKVEVIEKGRAGVILLWSEAIDDEFVKEYNIYQNGQKVKTVSGDILTTQIERLVMNTNYVFKIEAVDNDNNETNDGPIANVLTTNDIPTELTDVPELDKTTITDLYDSVYFIFGGINPVQIGVKENYIQKEKIAVLRGKVLNENNEPVQGVLIKVLSDDNYGYTYTRNDGWFDIAVNGGSIFTIDYQKDGFIPIQRKIKTKYQNYFNIDDAIMIGFDEIANEINTDNDYGIAKGTPQNDKDGQRTGTVFFNKGTTATLVLPDNSEETLTNFTVRLSEFTTGDDGVKKMPAELSANTGYTYAVELSVDEGVELNAKQIKFNKTVYYYLENFLNFNNGTPVPSGYYNRETGNWVPSPNGSVIKILNNQNGIVSVDINGDNIEDDFTKLEQFGFTEDELNFISLNYQINQTLWRVPLTHFTPIDLNYPIGCDNCALPEFIIEGDDKDEPNSCEESGSIINVHNATLGEVLPIKGTPFTLVYNSGKVKGKNEHEIKITPQNVPENVKKVLCTVYMLGKVGVAVKDGDSYTVKWYTEDAYNREFKGKQKATVKVDYVYDGYYITPGDTREAFGDFSGTGESLGDGRVEVITSKSVDIEIGDLDFKEQKLGGWFISGIHTLIPSANKIFFGYGDSVDFYQYYTKAIKIWKDHSYSGIATHNNNYIYVGNCLINKVYFDYWHKGEELIAGDESGYNCEYLGNNINAKDSLIGNIQAIATDNIGNVYISDKHNINNHSSTNIRKIDKNNIITTIAGNDEEYYTGDGENIEYSVLYKPTKLRITNNNEVYFIDRDEKRVRKVDSNEIINTVYTAVNEDIKDIFVLNDILYIATTKTVKKIENNNEIIIAGGENNSDDTSENIPATNAKIQPVAIYINNDGSFYIAEDNLIKYVDTNGIITKFAGNGSSGYTGDGGNAKDAKINYPIDLIAKDNYLYFADKNANVVRKIDLSSNIISTVAGTGSGGYSGDNGIATSGKLYYPMSIVFDEFNNLLIADYNNSLIRKVDTNGIITTIYTDLYFKPVSIAFDNNNILYAVDKDNNFIKKANENNNYTVYAGNAEENYNGDNLSGTKSFVNPVTLTLGDDGAVYFIDNNSNSIRKLSSNGIITKVGGTGTLTDDGTKIKDFKATLPNNLIFNDGELYFTDNNGKTIRKIDNQGKVYKVAGNQLTGWTNDGTNAKESPINVTLMTINDKSIYWYDATSERIFYIDKATGIINYVAGGCNAQSLNEWYQLKSECVSYEGSIVRAKLENVRSLLLINDKLLIVDDETIREIISEGYSITKNETKDVCKDKALPCLSSKDVINIDEINTSGYTYGAYSKDGSLLYSFDNKLRHNGTYDSLTKRRLFTFEYDNKGLIELIRDDLYEKTITFTRTENEVVIKSYYGDITKLTLNEDDYLQEVEYNDNANSTYKMDYYEGGLLKTFTNPNNNSSTFYYDNSNKLTKDQNAANGFKQLSRSLSEAGYSITVTTAMGRETSYKTEVSENNERFYENTNSAGKTTTALHKTNGTVRITKPNGMIAEVTKESDPQYKNQLSYTKKVTALFPSGKIMQIENDKKVEYNNVSNDDIKKITTTVKVNNSRTTTKETFLNEKYVVTTSPMGKQSQISYNDKLQITKQQILPADLLHSMILHPIEYTYDTEGRVIEVKQGERFVKTEYNERGLVKAVEDSLGRREVYAYDSLNRLTEVITPDNKSIKTAYDNNGNATQIEVPFEKQHNYEYTPIDLVKTYSAPLIDGVNSVTSYKYNLDSQIEEINQSDEGLITYQYDDFGRVEVIDNGTNLLNLSYNNTSGQLSRIEKDNGLFLSYDYDGGLTLSEESNYGKVEFEYDNNLRVTKVKAKNNEISYDFNDDDELTTAGDVEYQHDEYGFVKKATLGDITENYYYNKYGEVYKTETFYQNNLLYSLEMSYNSVGMIVERIEKRLNETNTFTYTYDNANQLVEVFKNGTIINSYTYDDNGNRLSETTPNGVVNGRYDNQDRMSAYGSNVYSYTDRGSLKQKITSEGTTTYNYDFQGNLLNVTTPTKQIEYIVDARNRRIAKKVNGTIVQKFLYLNQLEPIAELDANDNIISLFIYGTRSNTPEYIIKNNIKYKVITNQLGSVIMVVNTTNGTVEQSIEYDSFGNILSDSNPNFQPFRLAGGLFDNDTQLTRFGARDYDAREGRWTSKDPIKFDGGRNFYSYCNGDPVNKVDVNGLYDYTPPNDFKSINNTNLQVNLNDLLCSYNGASIDLAREYISEYGDYKAWGKIVGKRSWEEDEGRYTDVMRDAEHYLYAYDFVKNAPNWLKLGAYLITQSGALGYDLVAEMRIFGSNPSIHTLLSGLKGGYDAYFGYGLTKCGCK